MNILNNLGLSISYNRVLELENMLATAVCKQFEDEGVVCPAKLRKGLFVLTTTLHLQQLKIHFMAQE